MGSESKEDPYLRDLRGRLLGIPQNSKFYLMRALLDHTVEILRTMEEIKLAEAAKDEVIVNTFTNKQLTPLGLTAILSLLSGVRAEKSIPRETLKVVKRIIKKSRMIDREEAKKKMSIYLKEIAEREGHETSLWTVIDYEVLYTLVLQAAFSENDFTKSRTSKQ